MTDAYFSGLQQLFDGEVMGERLLLALHAAAKNQRDAAHFAAILQLETQTKARLRPLLLRHGRSLAEDADLSIVPERVSHYQARTWRSYTADTALRLTAVTDRYRAIAALGPPEDQPILQAVVDHEQALVDWAAAEGEGRDGLDAITRLLVLPIDPG